MIKKLKIFSPEILKKVNYDQVYIASMWSQDIFKNLLKNKIFNEFYLFKSQKKLPTNSEFVKFNGLNILSKKYPFRQNLNSSYGKDTITLYNK